ncbi:MAG: hypothetical protein FJ088_05270, partial [Deltaproteobacteria bacterium]|nr:hypothetical protein [Deltaproteobacteria bacterium]
MALNTTGNKGRTHTELEGGKGREIYFRPERYDENSLGNINKEIVFLDSELNEIHGKIVNISQNGIAFALDQRSYYKSGDIIPNMKIALNNDIVYKGSISVTNSRFNSDGTVVYGARLLDSMLNVKTIIRLKDLKEYYETFRDEFTQIMDLINCVKFDEYKALLNDFRLFLLKLRDKLVKIQNDFDIDPHNFSMENHIHRGVVRIMDELLEEPAQRYFEKFNELTEGLDETTAENLKIITRACIHDLTLEGAICRRSFEKPLGYAGDFEIMNYLYGDHLLGNNLFAKF